MPLERRRIVLCDDSRTYATALRRVLEHDGSFDVVGVFTNAEQTLAELPRLKPDLVTMDVQLPGMSGLDAVAQIMASTPTPIVVLSDFTDRDSITARAAVAAGAIDAVSKAHLDLRDPVTGDAATLRRRLARLSFAHVVRHPIACLRRSANEANASRRSVAAIGIVASTGGPKALAAALEPLPESFPIPILVVQHIGSGFGESFARTLARQVRLPVALADDRARLQPGIWVAPEGAHLLATSSGRLALSSEAAPGRHCPSGDILLGSLAASYGREAVGIVLTGMGRDGAAGTRQLSRADGLVIAQDEASSAVFGMPRAAIESGAQLVLAPEAIARLLAGFRPVAQPKAAIGTPSVEGRARLRVVR
jgi:two-component system, chemotaxis family, protein-glutamate methylesterase/glutaminase